MDNVKAAVESMAELLKQNPAVRVAWLNYAAADADRYNALALRVDDLWRSQQALRSELNAVIADAVRQALEGNELRVMGLGSLVDAMNSQIDALRILAERVGGMERRVGTLETRGDIRTSMLTEVLERLPPPPPVLVVPPPLEEGAA